MAEATEVVVAEAAADSAAAIVAVAAEDEVALAEDVEVVEVCTRLRCQSLGQYTDIF